MVRALFDTCILIDYLNGIEEAKNELERFEQKAISVITWMEVMVGANEFNESKTQHWLNRVFEIIGLSEAVASEAVRVRKEKKVKLPDAIIYASAKHQNMLLVTRNTKDFRKEDPAIRVPYEILAN